MTLKIRALSKTNNFGYIQYDYLVKQCTFTNQVIGSFIGSDDRDLYESYITNHNAFPFHSRKKPYIIKQNQHYRHYHQRYHQQHQQHHHQQQQQQLYDCQSLVQKRLFTNTTSSDKSKIKETNDGSDIPPSFLSPTASRYAYVATCAAEGANINPSKLFEECFHQKSKHKHKHTQLYKLPPFAKTCQFCYISPKAFQFDLPNDLSIPEIAFLGRSNVGKSTILNAIMKERLARVSKKPGRTQTINYYGLIPTSTKQSQRQKIKPKIHHRQMKKDRKFNNPSYKTDVDKALAYLIDLPGYGYAKAPSQKVSQWQDKTQEFLLHRRDQGVLKRVFLLIDSRLADKQSRYGSTLIDFSVLQWMDDAEIPYSIVLTKCDSQKNSMIVKLVNEICMRYQSQYVDTMNDNENENEMNEIYQSPYVHVTSGKTGDGINEILWIMDAEFFDNKYN